MNDIDFGELIDVDPREAWTHEALHFTPWLSNNLARLSKAIGLELKLVGVEQRVGAFAADIVALNTVEDTIVLIENQLASSDHEHLGQILTYLTGLKAETVVWVAPKFRDEHLSAIKWLNENTRSPFAFFAVKVRVVKIGASALAPLFEVLESPNDWDRRIEESSSAASVLTPNAMRRRNFWSRYVETFPDAASDEKAGGGASLWRYLPGTDLVISQWISLTHVGLFVRGHQSIPITAIIDLLKPFQSELEGKLGAKLDHGKYPLLLQHAGDVESDEDFQTQAHWLHDQVNAYKDALASMTGAEI